jgi:hypothetical protein
MAAGERRSADPDHRIPTRHESGLLACLVKLSSAQRFCNNRSPRSLRAHSAAICRKLLLAKTLRVTDWLPDMLAQLVVRGASMINAGFVPHRQDLPLEALRLD